MASHHRVSNFKDSLNLFTALIGLLSVLGGFLLSQNKLLDAKLQIVDAQNSIQDLNTDKAIIELNLQRSNGLNQKLENQTKLLESKKKAKQKDVDRLTEEKKIVDRQLAKANELVINSHHETLGRLLNLADLQNRYNQINNKLEKAKVDYDELMDYTKQKKHELSEVRLSLAKEISEPQKRKQEISSDAILNLISPQSTAWRERRKFGFGLNIFISYDNKNEELIKENIAKVEYIIDGNIDAIEDKPLPENNENTGWFKSYLTHRIPKNIIARIYLKTEIKEPKEIQISVPAVRSNPFDSIIYSFFSNDMIFEIQKNLELLGYDPGFLDGRMGPKTESAIRKYQHDYKIEVNGKANKELLELLKKTIITEAKRGT